MVFNFYGLDKVERVYIRLQTEAGKRLDKVHIPRMNPTVPFLFFCFCFFHLYSSS